MVNSAKTAIVKADGYNPPSNSSSNARSIGGGTFDEPYTGEEIPVDVPTRSHLNPEWRQFEDPKRHPNSQIKLPWKTNQSTNHIENYTGPKFHRKNSGEPYIPIVSDILDAVTDDEPSGTDVTSKPIIYSDWSPASRFFGMDQNTAFAEHMANTAHQREVSDLKAAGLNPVLGISGSGSSSVSGNAAIGSSSAEKAKSFPWIDVIGATAGVITAFASKNPMYGYMVANIFKSFDNDN